MKNKSLLLLLLLVIACVSQNLKNIELTHIVEASFSSTTAQSGNIISSQSFNYTLPQRIAESGISSGDLQSAVIESITATLQEPADSTFSIFSQLDIYLKNMSDSVQIATLSQENSQATKSLELRRITDSNALPFLRSSTDLVAVSVVYQLNTSLVDTLSFSINSGWLATGEIE